MWAASSTQSDQRIRFINLFVLRIMTEPRTGALKTKAVVTWQAIGRVLSVTTFCVSAVACEMLPQKPVAEKAEPVSEAPSQEVTRAQTVTKVILKADNERIEQLEREIARLKNELARAEETLVAVESGLQSGYTRADAVKSMAEAQIQLEKTMGLAPWHMDQITQAQDKLRTAQSHIDAGRFGAGLFFIHRVNSIVKNVNSETEAIRTSPNLLFVNKKRANLRGGPSTEHEVLTTLAQDTPLLVEDRSEKWVLVRTLSGTVGWIHVGLLAKQVPAGIGG